MNRWFTFLMLMLMLMLIVGCSNRQIYDSIQANQKNECLKQSMLEYEGCMERINKPYDKYEGERQEMLTK